MKPSEWCLGILMCFGAVGAWAAPPVSAPQQEVTVVVLNAGVDPAKPVQKVRVSLAYIDGATLITVTGATRYDATNSDGKAMLLVALEAVQRGGLRINIEGASDLVIYEPADGQLTGLPSTVTIKLLTKGSPALLGPAQINALLHRLSLQNKQLTQENREVKGELAAAQSLKPDELTAAMTEWARANGFAIADVDKQVQEWAEEIQQGKKQATDEQKALAELALKHYGVAASMFHVVATDRLSAFKQKQQQNLEAERKEFQDYVNSEYQSAYSSQMAFQYHQATQTLEQVRDQAAAEHNLLPEDPTYRAIWMEARWRVVDARMQEGAFGKAGDSASLLAQSIKDYQGLLQEYSMPGDPEDWAQIQNKLGNALEDQGERSSGVQATELLAQAVQAFRAALEVFTKADLPQYWATAQNNLGNTLIDQGERSSGTQSTDLFTQAVQAYRAALEVQTRADLPQDWAGTQNNLGNALVHQGMRSSGAQATDLLAQAVQAYRAALEVRTQADLPQDWAMTQNNLGNALEDQGERSSGAQATDLLAQAVRAYRAALEVQTKAELPQDWATTQNNLGIALMDQGERSSGAQAAELLTQAVQAYRAALEVYTKADLPQDWARTQNNLGNALLDQGERSSGAQATDLLAQAVQAYRAALEVRTKEDLPQNWAMTQNNLARALADQGDVSAASNILETLLEAFPTDPKVLLRAVSIDHEKLYRYDRAYELSERWLKLDASHEARLNMVEEDLTTSRFAECEKQAATLDNSAFPAPAEYMILIRDTLKLTCQWGAGEKAAAQETEKTLSPKTAQLEKSGWNFAGTIHFLAASPAFVVGRASWIALFQSLQDGDGAAMAGSLQQLDEVMKH